MATALENATQHFNKNKHIYTNPYNIVTIALWVIALSSHAILIPLFIREVIQGKHS